MLTYSTSMALQFFRERWNGFTMVGFAPNETETIKAKMDSSGFEPESSNLICAKQILFYLPGLGSFLFELRIHNQYSNYSTTQHLLHQVCIAITRALQFPSHTVCTLTLTGRTGESLTDLYNNHIGATSS